MEKDVVNAVPCLSSLVVGVGSGRYEDLSSRGRWLVRLWKC